MYFTYFKKLPNKRKQKKIDTHSLMKTLTGKRSFS